MDGPAGQREQRNWGGNISFRAGCSSHLSHGNANLKQSRSHTATKTWREGGRGAIVSLAQFPVTAYHLLLSLHPLVFCWTGQWPALFTGGLHTGKNTKSSPVTHLSHNEPKLFGRSIKSRRWENPEGWGFHLLFRGCWHRHTDGQRWGICSLQQAGLRASGRMLNKDINNEMSL